MLRELHREGESLSETPVPPAEAQLRLLVPQALRLDVVGPGGGHLQGDVGVDGGRVDGETVADLGEDEDVPGTVRDEVDHRDEGQDHGGDQEKEVEDGAESLEDLVRGEGWEEDEEEAGEEVDRSEWEEEVNEDGKELMVGEDVVGVGVDHVGGHEDGEDGGVAGEEGQVEQRLKAETSVDLLLLLVVPRGAPASLLGADVLHQERAGGERQEPAAEATEPGRDGGEVEVESVNNEDNRDEERGPEPAEVGEGEDDGEEPDHEVGPGEAAGLDLLCKGLRLEAVQHGGEAGEAGTHADEDGDVGAQDRGQTVTVRVAVTCILQPSVESVTGQ